MKFNLFITVSIPQKNSYNNIIYCKIGSWFVMHTSDRSLLFENTGAHKNSLKELGKYNKITQKYLKLFVLITILLLF